MAHQTSDQADSPRATTSPAAPDHTRSQATQPYRATKAAQDAARDAARLHGQLSNAEAHKPLAWMLDGEQDTPAGFTAPFRCYSCKTPHATQLQADLCCPANELSAEEAMGLLIGQIINRINGGTL